MPSVSLHVASCTVLQSHLETDLAARTGRPAAPSAGLCPLCPGGGRFWPQDGLGTGLSSGAADSGPGLDSDWRTLDSDSDWRTGGLGRGTRVWGWTQRRRPVAAAGCRRTSLTVNLHVSLQVIAPDERLVADVADVRALSGLPRACRRPASPVRPLVVSGFPPTRRGSAAPRAYRASFARR